MGIPDSKISFGDGVFGEFLRDRNLLVVTQDDQRIELTMNAVVALMIFMESTPEDQEEDDEWLK